MNKSKYSTRVLTVMGMMLAMIVTLSALEHSLPPIPFFPPNVRLGLSNIITMYAFFFIGRRSALLLTVLKSLFVLLTRGATAGFLSLCGGLLSVFAILILIVLSHNKCSYLILSIAGAIFHNLGQIAGASLLLGTRLVLYSLPSLLVAGILTGAVTGTVLRIVMPLFDGILGKQKPPAAAG